MTLVTGAGLRNKRITIERPIETRGGDYSDPQNEWVTYLELWASIEPLSGREFLLNREQQTEVTVRMRVLYFPDVTNKMRVIYRDKIYQIVSVIDAFESHEELELMCSDFEQPAP